MSQEKKAIRIIHTSDIHLGGYSSVDEGDSESPSQQGLKALVDLSIGEKVSLVIVAGDLFEHNRVEPALVEWTIRELYKIPAPVLILPGNHDCLIADSIYRRPCFSEPDTNINVFTAPQGERFSFPDLDLAIWGKPIISYEGNFHPMADIPPRGKERWQIAVAHGYYVSDCTDQIYSYQITEEEIAQSCQDYVALGHSTGFRCVFDGRVKAYYSGAPQTGAAVIIDLIPEVGVHARRQQLPL